MGKLNQILIIIALFGISIVSQNCTKTLSDGHIEQGSTTNTNSTIDPTTLVKQSNLVGYWNFDESVPDSLALSLDFSDSTNKENHLDQIGSSLAFGQAGRFSAAPYFDGNSYLDTEDFDFGALSGLTFSAWVKNDNAILTKAQGIVYKWSPVMELSLASNGKISVSVQNSAAWHISVQSPAYQDWNKWHHIVAVYDGSKTIIYRDGIKVGQSDPESGNLPASDSRLTIGRLSSGSAENFEGFIDDVAIWDIALNQGDAKKLFSNNQPASQ